MANALVSDDITALLEPYRRELTGYCYRMLGSGFEAEDAVQDTLREGVEELSTRFEGRSSLRSWLYRIATNVCLDMLRGPQRRARPMDFGPASPAETAAVGPSHPENTWVQPIPDAKVVPDRRRPRRASRMARETIRLAFVAALQHLPPAAALGAHPPRSAALAGHRGRRAPRHHRRVGEQRAAAGPGHARRPRPRRHDRPRRPTSSRRCSRSTSTPSSATTSTSWSRCCATTPCCRCRRTTCGCRGPTTSPAGFSARASAARGPGWSPPPPTAASRSARTGPTPPAVGALGDPDHRDRRHAHHRPSQLPEHRAVRLLRAAGAPPRRGVDAAASADEFRPAPGVTIGVTTTGAQRGDDARPEPLAFLGNPLPRWVSDGSSRSRPGDVRPYDEAEWRDALVIVEAGEVALECARGGRTTF